MRAHLTTTGGILAGLLAALLLWALLLGVHVKRHEPGLWTVRIDRIVACGLDYNGPAFTHGPPRLWLTCGGEDNGWQLWPWD